MPNQGGRCAVSCWRGNPEDSMAANARCKKVINHGGLCEDKNGNHFDAAGNVVVVRSAKTVVVAGTTEMYL